MSLAQKTLSVLLLTVAALIAALYGAARFSVARSFSKLEEQETQRSMERVRNGLDETLAGLISTTNDYAAWDRMYEFMKNPSADAIAPEFQGGTLLGLRINSALVIDREGDVVYSTAYDFLRQRGSTLSAQSQDLLSRGPWAGQVLATCTPSSGIIVLPEGPALVAVSPIVTAERKGPARGVVIMTRALEPALRDLEGIIRIPLFVRILADGELPVDFARARGPLLAGQPVFTQVLGQNTVAGYSLIRDLRGTPVLLLRIDRDRHIYQQGMASLHYFLAALCFVGLVFGGAVLLLLRWLVLGRLTDLNFQVRAIGDKQSMTGRVRASGGDEISQLGTAINSMLEALQKSQTHLHLLADNIHQAFWIQDMASKKVTYASPAFQAIWGHISDEPGSWRKAVHPEDRGTVEAMLERQQRGEQGEAEFRIIRPDGTTCWLWWRYFPVLNESDELTQIVGLAENITDYKDAEQVLLHSQQHLWDAMMQRRERLQSIGSLAAGIAHEIKTPIQFVGDNVRFLKDAFSGVDKLLAKYEEVYNQARKGQVAPQVLQELEAARETADLRFVREQLPQSLDHTLEGVHRVATIARAMKEFSYVDPSQEQTPVDLNHALDITITIARNEWKYVSEVEAAFGELPPVVCNLGEMHQVFLNLLVNAAHAIGEAVKDSKRKGRIRVETKADQGWAEVTISDTGTGIAQEIQHRVFEPFFTTKAVGKGSGQGLPLARAIVEKHGGSLTFETMPGQGTKFRVRIPLSGVVSSSLVQAATAAK